MGGSGRPILPVIRGIRCDISVVSQGQYTSINRSTICVDFATGTRVRDDCSVQDVGARTKTCALPYSVTLPCLVALSRSHAVSCQSA